jgi:hypothetical protein
VFAIKLESIQCQGSVELVRQRAQAEDGLVVAEQDVAVDLHGERGAVADRLQVEAGVQVDALVLSGVGGAFEIVVNDRGARFPAGVVQARLVAKAHPRAALAAFSRTAALSPSGAAMVPFVGATVPELVCKMSW